MDIDKLRGIGLPQYAELFRANDIDGELLGRLTNDDLKDIGVTSFGHRKKLLEAIADLGGPPAATPVVPASIPATVAPPPISASVEAAGERRYLTVMFCDLVGSTGISAQLDAEEWRDLVGAYLDAASAAVTEMGGHVAKKLGDGLMSLFGYPIAHENDAERAARAALAIQRALAEFNRKNEGTGKPVLAARIGLETGTAVVDAAGEIYGDVANIAARVQALAEPGAVLATARVQRQIAGLFVAEERGTHTLRGVPEPTVLFKLVRVSSGRRRSTQRNLTPLVGRDDEMTTLMRHWERARQGDGQMVLIVGEPGLGKSRLIEELHARLLDTPHTWVEWSCSQLLQNTPLHPITEWGRQRFGGNEIPAEQRLADLESSLAQVKLDPADNVPLLAPLLDIPVPQEFSLALAPEELRRRQLAAMTGWVMAGARTQTVVLAFEDLHWADPTTLDVLRGLADRGALAPLLIVATTRPEFRPPWSMRSHHGTISLAPLDRSQVRNMVAELSARHALPRDVVEDVAARTGGVPLFVEEVTRLLLEGGRQDGIQTIPPTLQQSLMARLDRLGPAREVAQVGSVIGRNFSYGLLRDVAGMEEAQLQAALEKLAEADILLVQGLLPESDYRFKHALIQDAAYENLLKSRRQVLHRRVAEILRDRFPDAAAVEPEALAHHFTQAEVTDAAIGYWLKAGEQALARSAMREAEVLLRKGLSLVPRLTDGILRREHELDLQITLGRVLSQTLGFHTQAAGDAYSRARQICDELNRPRKLLPILYGQWVNCQVGADFKRAEQFAAEMLNLGELGGDVIARVVGYRASGATSLQLGDFSAARTFLERGLELYDRAQRVLYRDMTSVDTHVALLGYLAQMLACCGYPDQARSRSDEAVAEARDNSHAPTLAHILWHAWCVGWCVHVEPSKLLSYADELVALSADRELQFWHKRGMMCRGWSLAELGHGEQGIPLMTDGLSDVDHYVDPLLRTMLADACGMVGQPRVGLTHLAEAERQTTTAHVRWCQSEMLRTRGALLALTEDWITAEASFRDAIALAQRQSAKFFELRAALGLARLWRDQAKPQQARGLLAPVYAWFTEGFDTLDLKEAKALLDGLAL